MDELSYLGGFIDGEGCVSAGKSGNSYHVMLSVSQINPAPLLMLQRHFGGRIKRTTDRRGYRDQIVWYAVSRRARSVLQQMLPYLIVKRREAELAIALQERLTVAIERDRQAELSARQELYQQLKAAKHQSFDHIVIEQPPVVPPDHKSFGKRLSWAKPKPPKKVRRKVSEPIRGEWHKGKKPSKDELVQKYHEYGPTWLAKEFGVSRQTIYNWLTSYAIERLDRSEFEGRRIAALKNIWVDPE